MLNFPYFIILSHNYKTNGKAIIIILYKNILEYILEYIIILYCTINFLNKSLLILTKFKHIFFCTFRT